jgi:integrase
MPKLEGPALSKFLGAIRSPFTSRVYLRCIQEFIQFLYANEMIQAKTVDAILTRDPDLVEQWILAWISEQKEQGLSVSIMHVRKSAVKLFYDVNKVQGGIAWKIIAKSMGENRKLHDRPYSREEIRKILDKADYLRKDSVAQLLQRVYVFSTGTFADNLLGSAATSYVVQISLAVQVEI